jgi:putative hydrolase of HD superfamily
VKVDDQALISFFFEVGQLKRQPRSGWHLLGIKHPESVADHTARSVFIAYVLAKLEGADPEKAALIAAFHELPEARIGDFHKMASHYFPKKKGVEAEVLKEQLQQLPRALAADFLHLLSDFDKDATPEHVVAKDADYLEVILQAKEYEEQGYAGSRNWIKNATSCLKTQTAKRLAKLIAKTRSTEWYEGLKRIRR